MTFIFLFAIIELNKNKMEIDKFQRPKLNSEQIEMLFGEDIQQVRQILNQLQIRKLVSQEVDVRN